MAADAPLSGGGECTSPWDEASVVAAVAGARVPCDDDEPRALPWTCAFIGFDLARAAEPVCLGGSGHRTHITVGVWDSTQR